jgi:hypothetical protein
MDVRNVLPACNCHRTPGNAANYARAINILSLASTHAFNLEAFARSLGAIKHVGCIVFVTNAPERICASCKTPSLLILGCLTVKARRCGRNRESSATTTRRHFCSHNRYVGRELARFYAGRKAVQLFGTACNGHPARHHQFSMKWLFHPSCIGLPLSPALKADAWAHFPACKDGMQTPPNEWHAVRIANAPAFSVRWM